jgi:hypothetical protein
LFEVAENSANAVDNTTAVAPPVAQETRLFQDQPDILSQMEDFDLFNSLDWSFDQSVLLAWP